MNAHRLTQWLGGDAESDYAADAEVLLKELSAQQMEMGHAVVKGLAQVGSRMANSLCRMHHTHPYRSMAIAGGVGLLAGLVATALCRRERSSEE